MQPVTSPESSMSAMLSIPVTRGADRLEYDHIKFIRATFLQKAIHSLSLLEYQ